MNRMLLKYYRSMFKVSLLLNNQKLERYYAVKRLDVIPFIYGLQGPNAW